PASFTGEDVVELQGHGGPVVLDMILSECQRLGCRLARPGEFSERAFLNDKMDLAQAEAIADLIDSASEEAARSALKSLQGEFSNQIQLLQTQLTELRVYVEAAIDFPEEEVDFLSDGRIEQMLSDVKIALEQIFKSAKQGSLLREGMNVVIVGRPNAGKSSLLNALAGQERAIVTEIEGTTRDVLKEQIHIDGMPLHIIDTAGLRDAPDKVEQIGIQRALGEVSKADRVLLMTDANDEIPSIERVLQEILGEHQSALEDLQGLIKQNRVTLIQNKADLFGIDTGIRSEADVPVIAISAQTRAGLEDLTEHLKQEMGFKSSSEGSFLARRRHLDALERAELAVENGVLQLKTMAAGELLAEDLRMAQKALGEITGEFSADDLLGEIFGSFCIGK
ncbi:MAG: tRNA uridine-5-carboxymethylaminomethyl(34) synthesis GTPase MnmE, partial [Oceanobacter sp.]